MKTQQNLKKLKNKKKLKNFFQKPWKAVLMTRILPMGAEAREDEEAVEGYLVDQGGNPIDEPLPWQPVYLRGLNKKSHPKWNVATEETFAIINKSDGWEIILKSGTRFSLIEIDRNLC